MKRVRRVHQLGQDAMQLRIKVYAESTKSRMTGVFKQILVRLCFVTPTEAAAVKTSLHDTFIN